MNIIIILFVVWVGFYTMHSARQRMGQGHYKELVDPGDWVRHPCYNVVHKVSTFAEIYCVIVKTSKTLDMIYCALREARKTEGKNCIWEWITDTKTMNCWQRKNTKLTFSIDNFLSEGILQRWNWNILNIISANWVHTPVSPYIHSRCRKQDIVKISSSKTFKAKWLLNRNFNIEPCLHSLTLNFGGNLSLLCINILKGTYPFG